MTPPSRSSVSASLSEASRPGSPPRTRRPLPLAINKAIVSLYKTFGFVVLTAILLGLAAFLFTKVFFLFNRSWIAPALISRSDDRVMRLNAEILQQTTLRDKLVGERAQVEASLKDAERRIAAGHRLQASLTRVAATEARSRRTESRRLAQLTSALAETKQHAEAASRDFATVSRKTLEEQYSAGLTTQDRYVAGSLQLSQLAQANLALLEKDSELTARNERMMREPDALLVSTKGVSPSGPVDANSLRLSQDFTNAVLDVEKAKDDKRALLSGLDVIDRSIGRYDELLKSLSEAPLLKARSGRLMTAFVPYPNLGSVHEESPVYACRLGMLLCRTVGRVGYSLSGEVSIHSPIDAKNERGVMVELKLDNPDSAVRDDVLFVNYAPLFL